MDEIPLEKNLQRPVEKVRLGEDAYVELLPTSSNPIRLDIIAEKTSYLVELIQRAKEEESIMLPLSETFGSVNSTIAHGVSNEFRANMMIFERKRILTTSLSTNSLKRVPSKLTPEITGSLVMPTIRKTLQELLIEVGVVYKAVLRVNCSGNGTKRNPKHHSTNRKSVGS